MTLTYKCMLINIYIHKDRNYACIYYVCMCIYYYIYIRKHISAQFRSHYKFAERLTFTSLISLIILMTVT